ncbi:rhodanese/Cell cycle control phosphatase superfamily protein [Tasmannia lanceolata]|uniref:rhodanese/Cell cycle control phosphatase superfamily protein n=1 Tax=Tasmannia lanceolata TaxID=3420 RepID=UPI0040640DBD
MEGGAALFGAHTPLQIGSSLRPIILRNKVFSQLRNRAFNPHFSTLSVRFKAFFPEQRKERNKILCGFDFYSHLNEKPPSDEDFMVVNFYRFVFIKDPEQEIANHLSFLQGRNIHGRIYVNEQGINAQYSGPSKDALAYVEWLKEDHQFSDILVQISPAFNGHAFPQLKLRYKPSLVQLEGGISHLPLLDPTMRATPLAPSEWRKKLQADNVDRASCKGDCSDSNKKLLLLDVRNGYEWDIGHFHGAQRPDVNCFRRTSFGLSESELPASDPLSGIDKERTDILMYCTGGIRCDVYSAILRQRGFQNLYTLKGGVSHYLESEGPVEWVGNLFVFDSRLSLPPSAYNGEAGTEGGTKLVSENNFARCYICGTCVNELRHRNCANLDCNLLFLCCSSCVKELRGCCCLECTSAHRLRPVLPGHQRYQKWHIYRDAKVQSKLVA